MAGNTTSAFVQTPTFGASSSLLKKITDPYSVNTNYSPATTTAVQSSPVYQTATDSAYQNILQDENARLRAEVAGSGGGFFDDKDKMAGMAGLGSVLLQGFALPSRISAANAQTKALKQNMATAKEEQDRRNSNISSFNSFSYKPSQPAQ